MGEEQRRGTHLPQGGLNLLLISERINVVPPADSKRKAVFGACPVSFETMSTPLRRSVSCFLMLFSEHLVKGLSRVLVKRMPLRSDKE